MEALQDHKGKKGKFWLYVKNWKLVVTLLRNKSMSETGVSPLGGHHLWLKGSVKCKFSSLGMSVVWILDYYFLFCASETELTQEAQSKENGRKKRRLQEQEQEKQGKEWESFYYLTKAEVQRSDRILLRLPRSGLVTTLTVQLLWELFSTHPHPKFNTSTTLWNMFWNQL